MFPGDFGVEELDVNCRCTITAVVEDGDNLRSAGQREAIWKQFDARAREWEAWATVAFREGLDRQYQVVVEAIRALL